MCLRATGMPMVTAFFSCFSRTSDDSDMDDREYNMFAVLKVSAGLKPGTAKDPQPKAWSQRPKALQNLPNHPSLP